VSIELSKEQRGDAVASIKRYFEENMPEPIGDLPAGQLLNFFLEDVGPVVYNKAVTDTQARIVSRASDLSGELYEDEFQYWARAAARRSRSR
jgi:uncharacterized protein (DUF2164 family)